MLSAIFLTAFIYTVRSLTRHHIYNSTDDEEVQHFCFLLVTLGPILGSVYLIREFSKRFVIHKF